jgi:hypothetical protein
MLQGQNNIPLIVPMAFNSLVGVTNRILQIVYYCLTNNRWHEFQTSNVKKTALTFCILPSALNLFMISIYLIFHTEKRLTPKVKLKTFFAYIFSSEILYPIGVHYSFLSKYSYNADNPIITMRLVNAIHFMFVAVPQLLVVTINSSARGSFKGVDIASLVFSAVFILWSVFYYFYCISKDESYDNLISDCTERRKED